MIIDIIVCVLLVVILGVLIVVLNRVSPVKEPQSVPVPVKDAFIEYIERESDILQHLHGKHPNYVDYEGGYPTQNGFHEIQLSAWFPDDRHEVAAVISIQSDSRYSESHYKKFVEHKERIEQAFSFEGIKLRPAGKVYHLRVVKSDVDVMQVADRDAAFRWLRENLEKLYYVLRVHDTLGWDTAASKTI